MGGNVPVPAAGSNGQLVYREIGTNIDVAVYSQTGQLFRVETTLEETSVYMGDKLGTGSSTTGPPSFRAFRTTNNVVLKDGQTTQVASAADPLTGDIVRVDLTLTVVK